MAIKLRGKSYQGGVSSYSNEDRPLCKVLHKGEDVY